MDRYTGLARKGMSMSKSSPSISASFALREFSQMKKRFPFEHIDSAPELILTEIDRLGGNGRWRERKAVAYFEEKSIEDQKRSDDQRAAEERKRQRKLQIESKKKRQKEEEEAKRRAHEESLRKEREWKEEQLALQREKERAQREVEEREWKARQPVVCELCSGSGLCRTCSGKGQIYTLFLSRSTPTRESEFTFGRPPQGCEDCGGCRQNIVGALQVGSGDCLGCNGKGKIWPSAAFEPKTPGSRKAGRANTLCGDFSPKPGTS